VPNTAISPSKRQRTPVIGGGRRSPMSSIIPWPGRNFRVLGALPCCPSRTYR
jgi:hypothetical protein